ncbi:MAG: Asp-tRNA(Asn)/Glu-tRNA(Gln) amidotransferase subunit GatC [Bacillota bacterium]|nr:Asp-tRNA(Asn)/Glu-tRNA(Gln) amidotransferase subunit GatC [Bacillota bacterium]
MATVEKDEILKLAKLSKLTFTDEEIEKFQEDMQSIISFADMINKANCKEAEVLHVESAPPLRPDVVKKSISQEDVLANAPEKDGGYFVLPRRNV